MERKISDFVNRSYACACNHGFHDMELSRKHFLMLVLSELGEVVEADRSGRVCMCSASTLSELLNCMSYDSSLESKEEFDIRVKDTVGDELADVCIRLFDYCGAFGIELSDVLFNDELRATWNELFGEQSLCENCYELCSLVCDIDDSDDGKGIGCVLDFIFCMCKNMGIDLELHIELKMRYNELRPAKHGKKY